MNLKIINMEKKCVGCNADITEKWRTSNLTETLCDNCLSNLEYGFHEGHPEWKLLCRLTGKIDDLRYRAKELRKKIDKEIFNKNLLEGGEEDD